MLDFAYKCESELNHIRKHIRAKSKREFENNNIIILAHTNHMTPYFKNFCYLRLLKSSSNFEINSFFISFDSNSSGHILVTN